MKILHINQNGTRPVGGCEKYLLGICSDLEKRGHEMVIISSSTSLEDDLAVAVQTSQSSIRGLEGSTQECLRAAHVPGKSSSRVAEHEDSAFQNPRTRRPENANRREYLVEDCLGFRSGLRVIDKVKEIIQREDPDVVNLHNVHLSPLIVHAIHRMKPTVQFMHDTRPLCLNGQKILAFQNQICDLPIGPHCFRRRCYLSDPEGEFIYNIRSTATKLWQLEIVKRLDKIMFPSKYMCYQSLKNGFSEKRIVVIPYYTDKTSAPSKPFIDENVVLFVGRLYRIKGVYQFIQSLNLIRDKKWQANIVGDGDEMNDAVRLTKRLGLDDRIHFAGKMPSEMVDSYYERCTLVVMPSMIPESFGLVGIEAMAFGKPVVAFNVGGVTEWLVHDEMGFLVERGDIQGLADRIVQLLDDKALAAKLGSAGQRQVEKHFRKDNHINGLMKVYEEVIERRRLMDYPAAF